MSDKETKTLLLKWAKRDGEHVVKSRLIMRRLSSSLVEKLVANRYEGEIRGANLSIIEDELRTAGLISSQDESA